MKNYFGISKQNDKKYKYFNSNLQKIVQVFNPLLKKWKGREMI